MYIESVIENRKIEEEVPYEVLDGYLQYAKGTWNSIDAMVYPETGLPADHLHYNLENGTVTETERIDKTSPTNIGFYLASVGAAHALGFLPREQAVERISITVNSISNMLEDSNVFIPTDGKKGLLVNWIEPSTGKVLSYWPETDIPVKQQLSSVDTAWFVAFSKLVSAQFPELKDRINKYLERMDLPFMLEKDSGFFHGCYDLNKSCFESWKYDVISEARIAYLVCDEEVVKLMPKLINRKNPNATFLDSTNRIARRTWNGEFFSMGWPITLVPENRLSTQWSNTILATIQAQRDFGKQHSNGHYGYSAGLGPDNRYYEYRVPVSGVSEELYSPQPVITISALVNMGVMEPEETYRALKRLHEQFPQLSHPNFGDGDTVNVQTGEVQRDQLLPNQSASLLSCWNIVKNYQPQELFMETVPSGVEDIYGNTQLI